MTVAERLSAVIEEGELDATDVARIVRTNRKTVSRWLRSETEPRWENRERLLELLAVLEKLHQVLKPKASYDWLFSPNPDLNFEKPVEVLQRGDFRAVLAVIDAIGEGVFT